MSGTTNDDLARARRARSSAYWKVARTLRAFQEKAELAALVGEEEDGDYMNDVTDLCDLFDLIREEEEEEGKG